MKVIIDISKDRYEKVMKTNTLFDEYSTRTILSKIIQNGTSIPENATNGDMIKAIFPNQFSDGGDYIALLDESGFVAGKMKNNWWNALYKAESEVDNE